MESSNESEKTDVGGLLTEVVDELLEGFQIISRDWRYLYVNKTVAEQGKKTKEELIGRTMMECYPGIEGTPLFAQMKKCMDENVSARFENEFRFPDGSTGWFQLCMHPVRSGLVILSTDITKRKQTETELKTKIYEVETLMDSAIDRELKMTHLKQEISSLKIITDREEE